MKISKKKWTKNLAIPSFYTSVPKIMIICYTVPEIWCMTNVIFIFHFWLFFALLPPSQPEKSKFKKNEKIAMRYYHFTQMYQKLWSYDVRFLRYCPRRTDGQMDRQKKGLTDGRIKKVTYKGGYIPKNYVVFSPYYGWQRQGLRVCFCRTPDLCHFRFLNNRDI